MSKVCAIITAGGKGSRMNQPINKVFLEIQGEPIIIKTIKAFERFKEIDEIILVSSSDEKEEHENLISKFSIKKVTSIVTGGKTRRESVYNGLKAIEDCDIVLIHDAARPFVTQKIIHDGIEMARKYGAASPGVKPKATLKKISNENIIEDTVNREDTVEIQTPQCFKYVDILKCHNLVDVKKEYTDDNQIMEECNYCIYVYKGEYFNIKITTEDDMYIAQGINEFIKKTEQNYY